MIITTGISAVHPQPNNNIKIRLALVATCTDVWVALKATGFAAAPRSDFISVANRHQVAFLHIVWRRLQIPDRAMIFAGGLVTYSVINN
jgi:hypothetical protein